MIKTNLSVTSHLANFIGENHESKSFFQKEIVTRVAGLALPIFAIIDVAIHSAGMLESGIKGAIFKQKDFSDFHKHAKCTKIFLRLIIPTAIYGAFVPKIALGILEDKVITCVNVLLLSKFPEFSEDCTVECEAIVKYIKKHVAKMNPEDLVGMEDAPKLLVDADKYLRRERLHLLKSLSHLESTHKLSKLIRELRTAQGSFIKTAVFRHCLARLLSLGLSVTCAVDIICDIFASTFILLICVFSKLLIGKNLLIHEKKDLLHYLASIYRDHLIHLAGTVTGSVIGIINPDTAVNLSDTHSSWYRKFHFKGERYTESLLEDLTKMKEGESLLIPLSFKTDDSGHIVYCLADRTSTGYNFSTLNTGYGSRYAECVLKIVSCLQDGLSGREAIKRSLSEPQEIEEKYLANYTFKDLTFDQLSSHVSKIRKLAESSFGKIKKKAKKQNCSSYDYTSQTLYPLYLQTNLVRTFPEHGALDRAGKPDLTRNPQLMFSSTQKIGDCPKASLLAALNYHCSHRSQEPNYQPYDNWIRKLQDRVYEQDGYLIDSSLNLKNRDRMAKHVAKTHLTDRWASYTAKYMTV